MSARLARAAPSADLGAERRDATIVIAESSSSIGCDLVEQLRADRYSAALARTTEHARALARAQAIRAIVLGALDAPHGALDLLGEIRGSGGHALDGQAIGRPVGGSAWDERLPAIVLSRGGGQLDLLRAFEMGADDFVAHPVSYLELRARLRAVLRRSEAPPAARLLCAGPLEIDTDSHVVRVAGDPVELCRLEYELLVHLARNPTGVCSKQELLRSIWNQRARTGTRTVDSHASRLRRKLDAAGASGLVVNVWGVGYRLV